MSELPPRLARRAFSIPATRELARRVLPRAVFDFADGGAEEERTLRRNEAAFGDFDLVPEPLRAQLPATSPRGCSAGPSACR